MVSEALANGLPVIGFSDCSGLNSLVVDNENGRLVDPGEDRIAALEEEFTRLLQDRFCLSRLSAAAPGSVKKYHPDMVYAMWDWHIYETVNSRRGDD